MLHDGRIVAERYARGYGIDTPLLGWSLTKSVTNALVGILVRQGKLAASAGPGGGLAESVGSAPRDHHRAAHAHDERAGARRDQQRLRSVLAHALHAAGHGGLRRVGAPSTAPPGTRYHYSSPSTLILSRIVTDAVGGRAEDVRQLAERELFGPVGMRHATLEFDAAGTPVGSTYVRDRPRLGALRPALRQRWCRGWASDPARGLGGLLGVADGGLARRLRGRLLHQPRPRRVLAQPGAWRDAVGFLLRLGHAGPAHRRRRRPSASWWCASAARRTGRPSTSAA